MKYCLDPSHLADGTVAWEAADQPHDHSEDWLKIEEEDTSWLNN